VKQFCMKVVNELTRMSNATPGVFRKTMTDVQVNGIFCLKLFWKKTISVTLLYIDGVLS